MELLSKIRCPQDLKKLSPERLPQLCAEIRERILETISKNGGHLSSSLGATELIVALHYVFDSPTDKFVFDTSHQTYAHKLLTGRQERFGTIRQHKGLSGFTRRDESEHDAFGAGHASTAISAALGLAAARDAQAGGHKVVAIVADGSLTGGEAYEGLQNAGMLQSGLIVVLNDNQMFISRRVGAVGSFLTRLLTLGAVRDAETSIKRFLARFQFWGSVVLRIAKRARVLLFPGMLFEEMGFSYFGPIDGHDVIQLVRVLRHLKELNQPVLLHCVTQKGKGYPHAEVDPTMWHGPGKFDVETGRMAPPKPAPATYTAVFGKALVGLAEEDSRIAAITAAMPEGTGTDLFHDRFPKRFYDVGLAEEHAVTFAAGLACGGMKPVVAIYSTFLQRGYDQIEHDVCLQKLPVVFCMDRGGLVGEDGPTHHGIFDFAFLRTLPNMTVMAPADENELQHMLKTALTLSGPSSIRYPRGAGVGVPMDPVPEVLRVGKGVRLREGRDLTFAAIGNCVHPALKAAELLEARGISAGVLNMRFVKPLDLDLLTEALSRAPRLVTVEDHVLPGGFGSAVLEALCDLPLRTKPEVLRIGLPDAFPTHGTLPVLRELYGLTPEKLAEQAASWMGVKAPSKA
ncbi:MAG TPA: 1-deoxy-D-xylulose-5-phosphate synthase [Elusimicrobia bacterium]|nr:1-deoxy-D-xylulose-5-phosphate synthase [Elusimicrobiota bacterium]